MRIIIMLENNGDIIRIKVMDGNILSHSNSDEFFDDDGLSH